MNVTGIEWREPDPQERKFSSKHPPRHTPEPAGSGDEDFVEIHSQADEETVDGMDEFE